MKTVIVIGGTKGVGKQIVIECIKREYNVIFTGTDENAASELLNLVNSESCFFIKSDLNDIKSLKNVFDFCLNKFGQLDGFIQYAGITPIASLTDCSEEIYDNVFDINFKSAFFCSQFAINIMQKSGGGSIIYFGSSHMDYGQIDRAPYAITKGALYTLSSHIAHHYSRFKIRSNYLVMGWTDTEGELKLRESQGVNKSELNKMASEIIPMGRMLNVHDPVPSVMFLLSNESEMITGSIIRVTGGEFI